MSSFNDAIERMKSLYTYGNINEDKQHSTHTIEYHQNAADGKSYGIIRECNKFYIKCAPESKALVAEAYDYIGGICNKKDYEYTSYNNALKNFEIKLASIKEAVRGDMNEAIDNFKTKSKILEGSDLMQMEIARQRQIMHNAAMIMNESSEIGAERKDDVVMYDKENPEAPKGGNTTPENKNTKADPEYEGSNTNGLDKDVTPFDEKVTVKEECECYCGEKEDWGSEGMCKGKDPKNIGWDIEGQEIVNEEEDWDEGLPTEAGVGEADTDHNNEPFNQQLNEEEEDVEDDDVEVTEYLDDEDADTDELSDDEEEIDLGVEDDENEDDEFTEDDDVENTEDGELDGEVETDDENEFDDDDVEDDETDVEVDLDVNDEDEDAESEETESENEFDDDEWEDFETEDNDELSDLNNDEDEEDFDDEETDYYESDEDEDGLVDECGIGECGDLYESKKSVMNHIVNTVVNEILNEDTLHVFGKHPGYRKKPMELPTVGSDHTEWGDDWNDESVHSDEPFGSKIGNGKPFDKLVDAVTAVVMEQLKNGKKKVK
jgi:hypothetical protein